MLRLPAGIGIFGRSVGFGAGTAAHIYRAHRGSGQIQKLDAGERGAGGTGHCGVDGAGGEIDGTALGRDTVDFRHCAEVHADEDGTLDGAGTAGVGRERNGRAVVDAAGHVSQFRKRILTGGTGTEVQLVVIAVGRGEFQLVGAVLAGGVIVIIQRSGRGDAIQFHILELVVGIFGSKIAGDIVGVDLYGSVVCGGVEDIA